MVAGPVGEDAASASRLPTRMIWSSAWVVPESVIATRPASAQKNTWFIVTLPWDLDVYVLRPEESCNKKPAAFSGSGPIMRYVPSYQKKL